MWWWKCVCCVIFLVLQQVIGEYHCYMTGKNLSCSALIEENLYSNITVLPSKEDISTIKELKILDSYLLIIKKEMFTNFKDLQNLYLQNTRTNRIEAEAFSVINNLNKLYLTNNYLEKISSNIFPVYNALHTLDLSHNLLNDLSEFDISMFPSIVFLNISHNRLEYLPENIMNKLNEENKFYLIADNNPWNCEHPGWVQHLTTIFIDAFCTNNIYDSRKVEEKMEKLSTGYLVYKDDTGIWSVCSAKCAFNHCLIWMFGAVWFGIILGNTCKIKRLLFTEPTRYEDKAIQCDKLDLMSKV